MDSNFGQKQSDITRAGTGDPRVASINSPLEVFDSFFSQAKGPVLGTFTDDICLKSSPFSCLDPRLRLDMFLAQLRLKKA